MVKVQRDLRRSSGPNLLLKQENLETVDQDHVQMCFEDIQVGSLHNLSRQPISVFLSPA